MPKLVDEAEQRRRIRAAARRVFARRGLAGTGLTHVAAAAGMGRSNLYTYYANREALLREMADELLAEEEALFEAALTDEGTARDRIVRVAESVTVLFQHWGPVGRLLIELWATEPERVRDVLRRVRAALADLIRAGQHEGSLPSALDPDAAAATLVAVIDGLLLQLFVDPGAFPDLDALRTTVGRTVRAVLAAGPRG